MRRQRYAWPTLFSALVLFRASSATLYVSLNSTNPVPPYADWNTAATNIQDAVDASTNGDLILVTNGVYQTGGRTAPDGQLTSVVVTNAVTLHSFTGQTVTSIDGSNSMRCIYLTNDAVLVGFTLTNGSAGAGGGAYGGTLSNCVLASNSASSGGGGAIGSTLNNCLLINNTCGNVGGGASACMLNNCLLMGNSTGFMGGGAFFSTLNNCTVAGNYGTRSDTYGGGAARSTLNNCLLTNNTIGNVGGGAWEDTLLNCTLTGNLATNGGGGVYNATLTNCVLYYNASPRGPNYAFDSFSTGTLNYCCTTPMPAPARGSGNITNEPLFVNLVGGDFHLQSNSPCINSGINASITNTTDFDGNPRIVAGTVDIGAYEYQTPVSKISYAWLQQYGLPINTNTDTTNPDNDVMDNYQEWIAGTNPTNALSVLAMLTPTPTNNPTGLAVSWESVNNRTYYLQSSTNLAAQPAFSTVQSNIVGQVGITGYMDTNAVGQGPYFYRVGVQ